MDGTMGHLPGGLELRFIYLCESWIYVLGIPLPVLYNLGLSWPPTQQPTQSPHDSSSPVTSLAACSLWLGRVYVLLLTSVLRGRLGYGVRGLRSFIFSILKLWSNFCHP
jgi:hypothetical protein